MDCSNAQEIRTSKSLFFKHCENKITWKGMIIMKYCTKCGAEMLDEAVICVKCGCPVETQRKENKIITALCKVKARYYMILSGISFLITIIMFIRKYISENKAYEIAKQFPDILEMNIVNTALYYATEQMFKFPFIYIALVCFGIGILVYTRRRK